MTIANKASYKKCVSNCIKTDNTKLSDLDLGDPKLSVYDKNICYLNNLKFKCKNYPNFNLPRLNDYGNKTHNHTPNPPDNNVVMTDPKNITKCNNLTEKCCPTGIPADDTCSNCITQNELIIGNDISLINNGQTNINPPGGDKVSCNALGGTNKHVGMEDDGINALLHINPLHNDSHDTCESFKNNLIKIRINKFNLLTIIGAVIIVLLFMFIMININ